MHGQMHIIMKKRLGDHCERHCTKSTFFNDSGFQAHVH